ncbi:MAG: putative hydro-lyase [Thermomicrobiales bacterium]
MVVPEIADRITLRSARPEIVRESIRRGDWTTNTVGLSAGYTQTNLVILPREYAYDFPLFCQRNPGPCPLVDVTEVGSPVPLKAARSADLRVDLPAYRVYEHGELVEEPASIVHHWRDDLVAFLLGCSYTFEYALDQANVGLRHLNEGRNVSMFRTNQRCASAGRLHGPLVVSMRPIRSDRVARAVEVTSRYPLAHGAPVWIGDPDGLGIPSITEPDWGETLTPEPGEVPVFWACGVTPQAVAMEAKPPLMITHSPGHMFITDIPISML